MNRESVEIVCVHYTFGFISNKLKLYGQSSRLTFYLTWPVSSNIYRPTINSTGPNLKTTLMTINSNHQNSKHDDVHVPNIMWTCQLCIR